MILMFFNTFHLISEILESPVPFQVPKSILKLGIEWNSSSDQFRLTIADLPPLSHVTKRELVSDVAKTFDVLGWFSPTTVKMKILLQKVWESKIGWDNELPPPIRDVWCQWRSVEV